MRRSIVLTTVIAIVFLLVGSLTLAQRRGPGNFGPGDGSRLVERLNRVLVKAGAEELTDAQANQIAELVQSREVNRPERPPEGTLMQDYGQAILNGDAESAKLIAEDIADEIAVRTAERLQSQADFQVALLGIIGAERITALREHFGDQGILRSLTGPGKMGRSGPDGFHRQRRGDRGWQEGP